MSQLVQTGDAAERGFNTAGEAINNGKTVQQIQTQYTTAVSVQKPRDLMNVEKKCMAEAALAGEICFYGWGSGKDRVEGPSIECAMIAARNFGNCAINTNDPIETPNAYILSTDFVDLETGFTYRRPFRQSKKWTVAGRMDDVRKDDVRFQIGVSKSQRNAILRAMPGWLIDKMIETAKKGTRAKIEELVAKGGIEGARKKVVDALARYSVTLERIEDKYERKYAQWDIETLVLLAGDIKALDAKMDSADVLFPEPGTRLNTETGEIITPSTPTGNGAGLSPEDMQTGDPTTHQGYEPQSGALPLGDKKKGAGF